MANKEILVEIKFCLGNITGRDNEVALKFEFDHTLVEQLKKVLNLHRYNFQRETKMQAWQAGGWLAEKKIWYIRQELWETVKDHLNKLGHKFVSMTGFEAERYIIPPTNDHHSQRTTESQEEAKENTKQTKKSKSKSKKQENSKKESDKDNSYYRQNRRGKQERENKQNQRNNNYKSVQRVNFLAKDYELLGVSINANQSEVKQAYRDLVEVWHPDRFGHNERLRNKAEEMLKLINAAYDRIKAVA